MSLYTILHILSVILFEKTLVLQLLMAPEYTISAGYAGNKLNFFDHRLSIKDHFPFIFPFRNHAARNVLAMLSNSAKMSPWRV